MIRAFDLRIAKEITDYYSPNTISCFLDTTKNELVFLNARLFLSASRSSVKCFYSQAVFDFDTRLIKSIPKSEIKYLNINDFNLEIGA